MNTLLAKTLVLLKKGIFLLLFVLFMVYFGIPSIETFIRKETIFIENTGHYSHLDFPVISITRYPDNQTIKEECYSKNKSKELLDCVRNKTFDLNNTIIDMRQNIYSGANSLVDKGKWEKTYLITYYGKIFSLQEYDMSYTDYLMIRLPGSGRYHIDLHDRNHYIGGSEQYEDFQRPQLYLEKAKRFEAGIQAIINLKIEKVILLPEVSNCNDEYDYSFYNCIKVIHCAQTS